MPLLTPLVVTVAVKLPAAIGLVANVTVSEVEVAEVTVPTAPSLKDTVLLPGVASKPKPLMVSVVALAARLAVLLVTAGRPWPPGRPRRCDRRSVVTTAVRLPRLVGLVPNVTVSGSRSPTVTVPTAPLLKTTVLWAAVGSKPKPLNGDRGRVGGQAGGAARHDRRDGGHLHCRAAAATIGGDRRRSGCPPSSAWWRTSR